VQRLRELRAQVEGLERAQQVARVAAEAKAATNEQARKAAEAKVAKAQQAQKAAEGKAATNEQARKAAEAKAAQAQQALIRVEALRDAALVRVRELTLAPVPAGAVFRMDGAGTAECNGFYKRNGTRPLAPAPYR
jgi:hypothetical protein